MRNVLQALILVVGVVLVVGGVWSLSSSAGVILAGVILIVGTYAWRYLTVKMGMTDETSG